MKNNKKLWGGAGGAEGWGNAGTGARRVRGCISSFLIPWKKPKGKPYIYIYIYR